MQEPVQDPVQEAEEALKKERHLMLVRKSRAILYRRLELAKEDNKLSAALDSLRKGDDVNMDQFNMGW